MDHGKPAASVPVEFTCLQGCYPPAGNSAVATSGADGTVTFSVHNYYVAGPGRLEISVPSPALTDTVTWTVLPGKPDLLDIEPADTSAYRNTVFTVRASLVDHAHNKVNGNITLTSGTSAATVASDGKVTTNAFGRGFIIASASGLTDTAWISVVPKAQLIVAHRADSDFPLPSGWYVIETNGTIVEKLVEISDLGGGGALSPDGTRFVYSLDGIGTSRIYEFKFSTRAVTDLIPNNNQSGWPEFTRDGKWIVYHRRDFAETGGGTLFRLPANGGAPERIPTGSGEYGADRTPSPSPDGKWIVYASNRSTYPLSELRLFDVESNTVKSLNVEGSAPRWSPNGELIAFPAGPLKTIKPDGTGLTLLTAENTSYAEGISWSPDGQWIVAQPMYNPRFRIHLVSRDGKLVLPLHSGPLQPRRPVWLKTTEAP